MLVYYEWMGYVDKYVTRTEKSIFEGVGPDTPTVTNEKGGSQSDVPYRMDLIDFHALFEIAKGS